MADARSTESIRNVVLMSHSGAGKTSLAEAILYRTGTISRLGKVDLGTTTSDFDPEEIKRKISINLSLLPVSWNDHKFNILDTPGYADFIAEVKAGLRVADGAIILVCAASGVEVGTEQAWDYVQEAGLPRMVVISRMDRENADFRRSLAGLESKFGRHFVPVQLPIGSHASFEGIIDLIGGKAYMGPEGKEADIPASAQKEAQELREKLVEAVAESDDELMLKYLDGKEIGSAEIVKALRTAAKSGKVAPVLAASGLQAVGIPQLLAAMRDYLPSPNEAGKVVVTNSSQQEEQLEASPGGPLAALVFKTTVDAYIGKLSHIRVYSGTISSNSSVWNSRRGQAERIGQLFILLGKTQEPVSRLIAGDIGAVAKLGNTETGDTLASQARPLVLPALESPEPIYGVALYPKTKVDVDKIGTVLPKLLEEDASLRVRKEPDTGEMILVGMGDTHVDVAINKMQNKFGIGVEAKLPKVPYKETITVPTKAEYKHKKQTGGHGQYGHVCLELEPLPAGSGFQFEDKVVGGAVPRNFIPAVEKGVNEGQHEGVLGGYPVVDVKVVLYDGSAHAVDSSEMSFKIASSYALKKGLSQGQPVLLEPMMKLMVMVPQAYTGDIVSDLNTKRGRVLGMLPQEGKQVIEAQVPLSEILRYAIDLRSITQGRGSYTTEFSHYEAVPQHLAAKIIEQKAAAKAVA